MLSSPTPIALSPDLYGHAEVVAPLDNPPEDSLRAMSSSNPPPLHLTAAMRRLSTPWPICLMRAEQLAERRLAEGKVLDPACGSGMQLFAYCARLRRPGIGIEIDSDAALLAAANGRRIADVHGDTWVDDSNVLVGDGLDAAAAIASVRANGRIISVLHVDPARPRDAQRHSLDEMEPPLSRLLSVWSPYLAEGPAGPGLIIDLSPRLSEEHMLEVEQLLHSSWPDAPLTWEWVSTGHGRIDRLTAWFGSAADPRCDARILRLLANGEVYCLGGSSDCPVAEIGAPPREGEWLTIVDTALVAAGLHDEWIERALPRKSEHRWLRSEGRRPLLLSSAEPRMHDAEVDAFVASTGKVVGRVKRPPTVENIDSLLVTIRSAYLSKLTLRCSLDPDEQPNIQRELDRAMRIYPRGRRGFLVDLPTDDGINWFVCVEPDESTSR